MTNKKLEEFQTCMSGFISDMQQPFASFFLPNEVRVTFGKAKGLGVALL